MTKAELKRLIKTILTSDSNGLDYCVESIWEKMQPKWIPVSERLPDYGVPVLVIDTRVLKHIHLIERTLDSDYGDVWLFDEYHGIYHNINTYTHWQPLPEPPKQ